MFDIQFVEFVSDQLHFVVESETSEGDRIGPDRIGRQCGSLLSPNQIDEIRFDGNEVQIRLFQGIAPLFQLVDRNQLGIETDR